ncbi:MAG: carbon-nitrogen hydrolase family protein [Sporichthyaceae bacterium]
MPLTGIATVSAAFGRDLDGAFTRITTLVEHARARNCQLLVLPDAALGGYLDNFAGPASLPPALDPDGPWVDRLRLLAREMVVCVGYCESAGSARYNSAVAVCGDGVLGRHRKVHQPVAEQGAYAPGDSFTAFDTPVGRMGMLIDYDKTFPESARTLAVDGARILACLSAWPTSITNRAPQMANDRQSRLFDLYDRARAAENQVVLVSSNQTGSMGKLRFLGQAKVVGPGGDVLARTWSKAGMAAAHLDIDAEIQATRRVLHHVNELRPDAYAHSRIFP